MDSQLVQVGMKKSRKMGFPVAFAAAMASSRVFPHKITGFDSFMSAKIDVIIGSINKGTPSKIFFNIMILLFLYMDRIEIFNLSSGF